MKRLSLFLILTLMSLPAFAGIHYKAVTKTDDPKNPTNIEVEGWVSADKAKVEFEESANPIAKSGAYLITKDGGKSIYLVDPEEETYAQWDLQAMFGLVGSVMQGMGPLLKMEFSDPKVEKLLDEDGGTLVGLPTRHTRYRTSYTMKVKVLGMGNEANVVTEQDIWATDKLQDIALGVWLRSDPPRTGNEQFDKLIAAEVDKAKGFPLKTVTVSTTTQKKGKPTTTRSTMEVTQLDTSANVAAASFEIPAGYQETQLLPTGGGEEEQGGLGGLLRGRKKKSDGDDGN
ncbi:MAG TPA: DUF4412 domain-containing protein [Thermoanaerobaculia bacterium]|jgi:hypothetical protein|nr:DUF4412 domain-containing protein [Thermoanaerobaculia bacterium]